MTKSAATPGPPPALLTKKKMISRPPKYHESPAFLRKESALDVVLGSCSGPSHGESPPPAPWYLGQGVNESYRLVATVARAVEKASLLTRPFSWGYGWKDGALAHNGTQRVAGVKAIAFFRHEIVRSVSAGNRLSLFLTETGRVYQSGRLAMKQDGCGMWAPHELYFEPTAVDPATEPTPIKCKIAAVEAGNLAGYALDDLGRVYSWGTHEYGQLGFEAAEQPSENDSEPPDETNNQQSTEEDTTSEHSESEDELDDEENPQEHTPRVVVVEKTPKLIPSFTDLRITKLSAGNHFVLAISASGHMYSWGRSCDGQLGLGELATVPEDDKYIATPRRIDALAHLIAVDVSAGDAHALGIFASRSHIVDAAHSWQPVAGMDFKVVYSWGRGQHGRLGLGGSQNEFTPRDVRFFRGLNATRVAAGNDHSLVLCGVASQAFLYAFGGNRYGQLGVASSEDHIDMPSFVAEFANVRIASIGAGARYSVALTGEGELFTWGDATYGKTHRSDVRTTFVPWKMEESENANSSSSVKFHLSSKFATQVSVGAHHALGLFRIHGEMDRWRKFPMESVVSYLHPDEGIRTSPHCICESSQSRTMSSFGIFVECETCHLEPICRLCARQCHVNHLLKPVALDQRSQSQSCACGDPGRAQPPLEQHQTQSGPLESDSDKPATATPTVCAFAKLQPRIPEDDGDLKSPVVSSAKPKMPRQ